MHNPFLSRKVFMILLAVLTLTVSVIGVTRAADNKDNGVTAVPAKTSRHLAVIYIPYSPYTYGETTSTTLVKCLQDALASNKFRPNGPIMYDTIVVSKQQVDSLVELFDTKVTPAKYPSGEAEILIEDQLTGKKIFVDQFGVVKTDTQQYQLKQITFERLHNLLRQIMPPLMPNKSERQK